MFLDALPLSYTGNTVEFYYPQINLILIMIIISTRTYSVNNVVTKIDL